MIVYIIGPYRGDSDCETDMNIDEAKDVARQLWAEGFTAVCPHTNSAHFGGIITDEAFCERYKELMHACAHAIFCVPGWQQSEGSRGEAELANKLGIPMFEDMHAIMDWAGQQESTT